MILTIKPTVYIIAGPTAVGKTAVAVALAQQLNTEIISADSRQCFSELSIGVARPSVDELAAVKHHFIADHSVAEDLNAGYFEQYALNKAKTIFAQNKPVVMVGGTGLYLRAFCEGIDPMPSIDPQIRQDIIDAYQKKGLVWLQAELKHKDPSFWAVAEQANPQRLMRALEVLLATGQSIMQFRTAQKKARAFDMVYFGLEMPMEQLTDRINARVDQMFADGLIQEAAAVIQYRHKPALQTVGYKELFQYLDGSITEAEAKQLVKVHTRQYAKRQMTWFKKETAIRWINMRNGSVASALEQISA